MTRLNGYIARRARRSPPSIMIAPLVDLVFTLLIFFMLITNYMNPVPAIGVELPQSTSGAEGKKEVIAITITRDGALYFDNERVTEEELKARLASADPARIRGVRLRADGSVHVQAVVRVLDLVRESPIRSVDLEVRRE